jgi:hypothetical protein
MPATFEAKVQQRLAETGLTMQTLATHTGLPEPELHALCQLGDPRLSEVAKLSQALRVEPTYFLNGSFLQAGIGNTQKIKIGKAAAHELAEQLGVCRQALEVSHELVAAKDALIVSKDALITLQAETMSLLREGYIRPN